MLRLCISNSLHVHNGFRDCHDFKRPKTQRDEQTRKDGGSGSSMDCDWEKNLLTEDEQKRRVGDNSLDKNYR